MGPAEPGTSPRSQRFDLPADIARAVLFLTDPANDWLTGHVLVVDGGLTS